MNEQIQEAGISRLVDNVEKIYRELKEEWNYQARDKINSYLLNMMQRYGEVKTILHGNAPKPFYDVYYPLSLSINTSRINSPSSRTLFRRRQALIVSADAGSGKSMLVRHLFNSAIRDSYKIPFFIELRYLNSTGMSLEEFISHQVYAHITESERIKKRMLQGGEFIFFFDGYDEVKKDLKQQSINSLKDMQERFTKCKFLISTRPYTQLEMLLNHSTVQIMPLSNDDVQSFIRRQLEDTELSERIVNSITEAQRSRFSSFLKNPLLLTLYILTYKNSSEIPSKASVFYRRVIDSLFIEHDSKTKVGFQRERVSKISFDKFYDVMMKFSFVSFFEDKFSFETHYACDRISRIISKDLNCSFSSEELIEDLKLSFSFWIDDSGELSFAHKSLQEYFCALYIRDLGEAQKQDIYERLLRKADGGRDVFNLLSILEVVDTTMYLQRYYIPVLSDFLERSRDEASIVVFLDFILLQIFINTDSDKKWSAALSTGMSRVFKIIGDFSWLDKLTEPLNDIISDSTNFQEVIRSQNLNTRKSRRVINLKIMQFPASVTKLLNSDSRLSEAKKSLHEEAKQLIVNAHHRIKVEAEIAEDILSMI